MDETSLTDIIAAHIPEFGAIDRSEQKAIVIYNNNFFPLHRHCVVMRIRDTVVNFVTDDCR